MTTATDLADELEGMLETRIVDPRLPFNSMRFLREHGPTILSALRRVEVMEKALTVARSGINAAFALAQAEYHNHDRIAERHDKTVQAAYAAIRQALTGEA